MKKYEYRVELRTEEDLKELPFQDFLNQLGAQGWELCIMLAHDAGDYISSLIFKREVL